MNRRNRRGGRARGRGFATAMLLAVVTTVIAPARADEVPTISLTIGQTAFWDGPFVEAAGQPIAPGIRDLACRGAGGAGTCLPLVLPATLAAPFAACSVPGTCVDYPIEVTEAGGTLRVALDHPTLEDSIELRLVDPDGMQTESRVWAPLPYSLELRVPNATAGTWTARVIMHSVERTSFRMRAFLEVPSSPAGDGELLPNIVSIPPFDLGFADCQPIEVVSYDAQRCLRFSTGPGNLGDGPLDLRVNEMSMTGTTRQRIHKADGTFTERAAGTFEYHAAHAHYHASAIGKYELYRVVEPEAMQHVSSGPKIGYCFFDYAVMEWNSFNQDQQASHAANCGYVGVWSAPASPAISAVDASPTFALAKGWGDVYQYPLEGQYVEFAGQPDGLYVLQVGTDVDNTILETNEVDNAGYALIEVAGDVVEVLERGRGSSPWDPSRVEVNDTRPPAPKP